MPEPRGFLLIHRTPTGKITAQPVPFTSFNRAAAACARILTGAGVAGSANARLFADAIARRPLGTIWGHPSGYDVRILAADFTEDGAPITPGARLFNYYDQAWGHVVASPFMAEGVLYPGGQFFDHWYDFARECDGWVHKLNGQRLATKENLS